MEHTPDKKVDFFTLMDAVNKREQHKKNQSQRQPVENEDELWNEVGAIFNGSVSFKGYRHFLDKLEKQFTIKRKNHE